MGFWVASADASGVIISSSAEQLSPGPAEVDYPQEPAGRIVDTSAGSRIKQLMPKDARPRAWIWQNLPTYRPTYVRFVRKLEALLGTTRQTRGLSPYVFLKDTESDQFRILKFVSSTATGTAPSTLTDSIQSWTVDALKNGVVEIKSGTGAGQRRGILSNTATQITVDAPWTPEPVGAAYTVQYADSTFVRARVLNVAKHVVANRSVSYDTVRVEFVVDDSAWNELG